MDNEEFKKDINHLANIILKHWNYVSIENKELIKHKLVSNFENILKSSDSLLSSELRQVLTQYFERDFIVGFHSLKFKKLFQTGLVGHIDKDRPVSLKEEVKQIIESYPEVFNGNKYSYYKDMYCNEHEIKELVEKLLKL